MKNLIFSAIAAVMVSMGPVTASTLALDLTTGGSSVTCGFGCGTTNGATFGWTFTLNSTVTVDALGAFDTGSNGLERSTQVGLWDSLGNLLASTAITSGSTQIASSSSLGGWLFEGISNLVLNSGSYVIGQVFFDNGPAAAVNSLFVTDTRVTYGTSVRSSSGSGLAQPTTAFGSSIIGPTFSIADVPLPAAFPLLLVALGGLGFAARRRKVA